MLLTAVSLTAIVSCSKNDLQGTETKKEQAVSMASSTTISPNLLVQEDFEGTTYFPNSGTSVDKIRSYENCNPSADEPNGDIEHGTVYDWTLMRKTDHVFEGSKSGYFEIRKDQPLVGGSQRIRSEVVVISGKEDTRWTPDAWYSFAVLFPTDGIETDNDSSETLIQWWEYV